MHLRTVNAPMRIVRPWKRYEPASLDAGRGKVCGRKGAGVCSTRGRTRIVGGKACMGFDPTLGSRS